MRTNGRVDQEGTEFRKQTKRCTFFSLSEMRKWLGGVIILFVFMILLLRFKLLEGPLLPSSLGMLENQPSLGFLTNQSKGALNADIENTTQTAEPLKKIEKVSDPPFIGLALSQVNSSAAESSVLSIWKPLKPVFSRLDCFPEAKQGLKEAENSWQQLMDDRRLEKLEKGNQSVNRTMEKQCPYSVSSLESTQGNGPEVLLEVPCGLIVDSSITIVGMPLGAEGVFAIELLGPKLPGESEPPIVLHFNVRLQGDKITDAAVIVQNTWTRDHDWGDEERCPTTSANPKKVDGLDTCIEQVGKAAVRKVPEAKDPMIVKWPSSLPNSDKKPWFPFINGFPFAATLWVGWEGFHMTVNGKHVTSFEYRQNLEPSLANFVRLKGGVKPFSIIATGLPASEDVAQVLDLEFLKAPPLASKQRSELFIGVFSTGNNFDRRMAVRRSWMQYEAVRSGLVTVRFFVGQHNNKQVNKELWNEALTYGDIQLMPFVDYYNLITLKTIAICIFGTEIIQPKYIMKTDDDTFVRVDEVLSVIHKSKKSKGLLCGSIEFKSQPHRDSNDKWYVSEEEWPHSSYPPWAHGPGYVISKDIARFIVQSHYNRTLKLFKLEDVSMGIWIEEYKKKGNDIHYIDDERFNNIGCSDGYVIAHYQKPKHMACLWQKLKETSEAICCN